MQIETLPTDVCNVCLKKTVMDKHYSTLSDSYYYSTCCENNHKHEYLMELIEVCPICQTPAVFQCNCTQKTKRCKNNHSWMKCTKCKYVSVSKNYNHMKDCAKCKPGFNSIWNKIINVFRL